MTKWLAYAENNGENLCMLCGIKALESCMRQVVDIPIEWVGPGECCGDCGKDIRPEEVTK